MKKILLSLSIFTVLPCALYAQDLEKKELIDMSLAELMEIEVVTASQSKQKITDAPATIHVVTEEQIKDRGYSSLEDLLEDIPEIEIQRKSVAETSNYYSLRGIAGNEKFMILLDGIRINSMAGTPHTVGANYSIANAKRVEVILGPASSLYGVDAFSGIINIITRTGNEIQGAEIRSSYGSFNTADNSVVMGYGGKNFSLSVTGGYYHSDEPYFPKFYKDEFSWYNEEYKKTGMMRLAPFAPDITVPTNKIKDYATPTDAYFVHAGATFGNFEVGYSRNMESHNSSTAMRPEYSIYAKDAKYKTAIESFYARNNFVSENEKWTINSSLSMGSFELNPESKFLNTFTGYRDGYKYEFHRQFLFSEQISYQLSANSSLIGGFSLQDITALAKSGDLPHRYDKNRPKDLQNMYYVGTNTRDRDGRDLTIYQDFYNVEQKNLGTFLQYRNKIHDVVDLTLGARYDYNTRYGASVNPRAGVVVSASKNLKLKVLYGEAFLAPSIYKAFQHYGGFITVDENGQATTDPDLTVGLNGPFWHLTNPDLKPEKLRSSEIGASYLKENFAISFDGYYNKISNLITTELQFDQSFKGVNVSALERPINKGNAETYGFTLKLDYFGNLGRWKLQSYAAYTFSNGEVDGSPLPYSARSTIKSGVVMKNGRFSINPRVIYRTRSFHGLVKSEEGGMIANDAFVLVNLFSKYSLNKNTDLTLRVRNLLDARYYNLSLAYGEGFATTPQDPIKFELGIRIKL